MNLRTIYPYWSDTHLDVIDLLESLTAEEWVFRTENGPSIREIVTDMIYHERHWIGVVVMGQTDEPISLRKADVRQIVSELTAARANTVRFVEGMREEGLRSVRTAPADPVENEPERNVSVSWILWNVLQYEIFKFGQISLLVAESRAQEQGR